ncbi:type II toxin-antitoxin system RelE/ParE family toxin [Caballeronia sordidicola]|jgi:plasmid stabilization system protein ParE|uniref:Death on curing protein, Doc toxin n=1 Tax=Caballeronia sordidicola TaxID=196367 RepID=A0A242M5K6_CABSO|nr:type II toxin-antitoxin system RelE/ParE family toxin [Caballeronia sordidicola]OTP66311.1 Death on curing protein, Doc toxin [Caballeronia sordidicola]
MTFEIRFTGSAADDLERLYEFILTRDPQDLPLAQRALSAVHAGIMTLRSSPFTCRKAHSQLPFLRELIIPFGGAGYVALFEIDDSDTVTILAVRHQLEDDYH